MENISTETTSIDHATLKFRYLDCDGNPLSFRRVVNLWAADDASFRALHCQILSEVGFKAFRWETPVVDLNRFDRPFEFIVRNDPHLDRPEDSSAFKPHFDAAPEGNEVTAFTNLGGNAVLVVPLPGSDDVRNCHLASFLTTCSASQESSLWQKVGCAMLERVSDVPVWLSTAGGGVAWLHIRLDDQPKYYTHIPYKQQ